MSAELKIKFFAGTAIHDAAHEAIRLASLLRVTVTFDFNDVHVMVHDDHQQVDVVAAYHNASESKTGYKVACGHPGTWDSRQIAEHSKRQAKPEARP